MTNATKNSLSSTTYRKHSFETFKKIWCENTALCENLLKKKQDDICRNLLVCNEFVSHFYQSEILANMTHVNFVEMNFLVGP